MYLLIAIGSYGGYKLAQEEMSGQALAVMGVSVLASFMMPFATFLVLRIRLAAPDAAAIAASFGSISAVTFITAAAFLEAEDIPYSGFMVASMALMESPAIIAGVLLARLASERKSRESGETSAGAADANGRGLWRDAALNGAVMLLVGSMIIGYIAGEEGWASISPLMYDPFTGVLCLFLLDMGLVAARRLDDLRQTGLFLILFGVVGAVAQGLIGVAAAWLLGTGAGDALLLAILFGSASYIAVPAAMRLALPEANPSLYITLALTVTFPFNIIVGIPMYHLLISALNLGAT
jgi:hypothetical protein